MVRGGESVPGDVREAAAPRDRSAGPAVGPPVGVDLIDPLVREQIREFDANPRAVARAQWLPAATVTASAVPPAVSKASVQRV